MFSCFLLYHKPVSVNLTDCISIIISRFENFDPFDHYSLLVSSHIHSAIFSAKAGQTHFCYLAKRLMIKSFRVSMTARRNGSMDIEGNQPMAGWAEVLHVIHWTTAPHLTYQVDY